MKCPGCNEYQARNGNRYACPKCGARMQEVPITKRKSETHNIGPLARMYQCRRAKARQDRRSIE